MTDLAQRFTKWYYQNGYRMEYQYETTELMFHCPWWVRPIVYFLFSPCTYHHLAGYEFSEGFMEGIEDVHTEQRLEDTEETT